MGVGGVLLPVSLQAMQLSMLGVRGEGLGGWRGGREGRGWVGGEGKARGGAWWVEGSWLGTEHIIFVGFLKEAPLVQPLSRQNGKGEVGFLGRGPSLRWPGGAR